MTEPFNPVGKRGNATRTPPAAGLEGFLFRLVIMYRQKEIEKESHEYAKKEALVSCGFDCKKCNTEYVDCAHYDGLYSIMFRTLVNRIDSLLINSIYDTPISANIKAQGFGYVYFINKTGTNEYKIGITRNVKNRMSGIRSASGNDISIIHTIKNYNVSVIESILHEKYTLNRTIGEWFVFDLKEVKGVIKSMDAYKSEEA